MAPADVALFEWNGGALPGEQPFAPEVEDGDLGEKKELVFSAGKPAVLDAPFDAAEHSALTVLFYLNPDRIDTSEDLVGYMWDESPNGFRVRNAWGKLTFEAGDGTQNRYVTTETHEALLRPHAWQHVAVVFDHGKVSFYLGGQLVQTQEMDVKSIVTSPDKRLRIGAAPNGEPTNYCFRGRMAFIQVIPETLTLEKVQAHMKSAGP